MLDRRGRLLRAALGFAGLPRPSYDRALWALRFWLDSWSGIGHVVIGMGRQGFDLQLTRYDERGWRATFYTTLTNSTPGKIVMGAITVRGLTALNLLVPCVVFVMFVLMKAGAGLGQEAVKWPAGTGWQDHTSRVEASEVVPLAACERTSCHATQRAAWEALRFAVSKTTGPTIPSPLDLPSSKANGDAAASTPFAQPAGLARP